MQFNSICNIKDVFWISGMSSWFFKRSFFWVWMSSLDALEPHSFLWDHTSRCHARSSVATACSELCVVERLSPPRAELCRLCSPPMPGAVTAWPHALTLTPALQEACTRKTFLFIERFMEHDGPYALAKDKTKKSKNLCESLYSSPCFWQFCLEGASCACCLLSEHFICRRGFVSESRVCKWTLVNELLEMQDAVQLKPCAYPDCLWLHLQATGVNEHKASKS